MAHKYPLAPLLAVRRYREDAAQNAVRNAEMAVQAAENAVREREKKLQEYSLWRVEEENRRYAAIMEQKLALVELEQFRTDLAALGHEEWQHAEALASARQTLEDKHTALQQARSAVKRAQKETARIVMHKDIWNEGEKREAARQEDLEMEEFKPLILPAGENSKL